MENNKIAEFFRFQLHRKITNLYKNYLILLEDLYTPPYNQLNDQEYKRIRKKILDMGNDIIREVDEDINKLNITLK